MKETARELAKEIVELYLKSLNSNSNILIMTAYAKGKAKGIAMDTIEDRKFKKIVINEINKL